MRTRTQQDIALFGAPAGQQATWLKVEIDRTGSGAWVDLTDLNGDDWVVGASYQEAIGTPAMSAVVTLAAHLRGRPAHSLVPMMASSTLHTGGVLIKKHNLIRISVAIAPIDSARPSTFNEVFDGRIDKWASDGQTIRVECRCLIVDLQSRFVETEGQYGDEDPLSATAADVEEVMQNILDDHINTTASAPRTSPLASRTTDGAPWQLYSDDGDATTPFKKTTGAAVLLYQQAKEPIWQALQKNASCIQWRLSRRWLNAISDWALVFEQPTRTGASSVLTIDPKTSQAAIRNLVFDGSVVRNVVQVGYQDGGGARQVYETNDATSISDYGRQFISLDLGATSQINTSTEATTFGDAVLADCKDPVITATVILPYVWYLQLNDLVTLGPDDLLLDASQDLAVIAMSHAIQQGAGAATTLVLEGAPTAGNRKQIQAQRAYAPQLKRTPTPFNWGSSMHTNGNFADDEAV